MKRWLFALAVIVLALLLTAFTPPPDLHCPGGWLAKYNVGGAWENPSGGSFGMSSTVGFERGVDSIWSGSHTLTGFCVKAGRGNTGILPMSALPWRAGDFDASHYVMYGFDEPEGEWCGRCSNIFEGWVEWFDRDGGCDDDFYNQRSEYPGDPRCVDEPVCSEELDREECPLAGGEFICEGEVCFCQCEPPKKPPCTIRYYELIGRTYNCYLTRNLSTDSAHSLPPRFDGTGYMQSECNKLFTCGEGWTTGAFMWTGKVNYKCNLPCLDCP